MGSQGESEISKRLDMVELVPWDPRNEEHYQRLYEQRVACTWDAELVEEWKTKVLEGRKFLYWIKLRDDLPQRETVLAPHLDKCPKERDPLVDTATAIANTPRTPTNMSFLPIGHVALELYPQRNTNFSLDPSTIWVKSLYISWALQTGGVGHAAMAQIERLAASPPLNAAALALDTVTKEFQLHEENLKVWFEVTGIKRPDVVRSNEEWYVRQGYKVMGDIDLGTTWTHPAAGETASIPSIYLKKDIV
ncbi:hypothetical protein PT974_01042 [Cladobotryum mycophilum]|uniref:N-acetyltransferase domain-containing protein n=1 Tax=Cladobotryum mycophilum TaxID=491253 RepID=A0ABR0T3R4_9HYPO